MDEKTNYVFYILTKSVVMAAAIRRTKTDSLPNLWGNGMDAMKAVNGNNHDSDNGEEDDLPSLSDVNLEDLDEFDESKAYKEAGSWLSGFEIRHDLHPSYRTR